MGSATGAPGYPPLTMFKILLLEQRRPLSDPAAEEAVSDRLSFRGFCGLPLEAERRITSRFGVSPDDRRRLLPSRGESGRKIRVKVLKTLVWWKENETCQHPFLGFSQAFSWKKRTIRQRSPIPTRKGIGLRRQGEAQDPLKFL